MIPNRVVNRKSDAEESKRFVEQNLVVAAKAAYKLLGIERTEDAVDNAYACAKMEQDIDD